MDTPKLLDYICYCKEHGYASAKFLQMNGFAFRSESELDRLMESIKDEGVEIVDLTMYGTKEYHDKLEARDISFLSQLPSVTELAKMYGRKDNQEVYRFRDLLFRWRQEYIEEKGGITCNMLEETQDFSIHL